MQIYRLYRMAPHGRLEIAASFEAADDGAALPVARDLARGLATEIWQGGRLLGRLGVDGAFTPEGDVTGEPGPRR